MDKIEQMIRLLQVSGINSKDQVIKMLQEMHNQEPLTVDYIVDVSHSAAKEKGWWDQPKTLPELICLVHSELSEALEEVRNGHAPNETYYSGKIVEQVEILGYGKTEQKIFIECETSVKYAEVPLGIGAAPDYSHMFTIQKPEGIPSELADVYIRIADICGYYGIDLDAAIKEKLEYNKSRSYRHGNKVL